MDTSPGSDLCSSSRFGDSEDDDTTSRTQSRKSNKPLLEKKRRARINQSLDQLKALVLDALRKDSARYSKLEKADILEMTVKHLKETQRHQMAAAMTVDPTVISKYHDGFEECATEVQRYLGTIDGLNAEVRMRLMQHLQGKMQQVQQMTPYIARPVYPGVPGGSPLASLPGHMVHCSMPYGGLSMTSPPESISPLSLYKADYNRNDVLYTPTSCVTYEPHGQKYDNTENIAPARPLTEKTNNTNAKRHASERGDSNNNVCPPAAKRQKLELHSDIANERRDIIAKREHNHVIKHRAEEELALVKMEPVWRPW